MENIPLMFSFKKFTSSGFIDAAMKSPWNKFPEQEGGDRQFWNE